MARYTIVLAMLASAWGLLGTGCSPAYRDPETGVEANYGWETLKAELDLGIREVYPAARAAADELDLKVMRSRVNGIAAEVYALDAHLDSVDIRLEAMPQSRTLLTIRIGLFGNRNKSIVLFDQIVQNLAQGGSIAWMGPRRPYEGLCDDRSY